ncbi:phosphodiesterase [Tomitella biformata]|uniref:phosphodiesterase n=1 Tax=Tomitella biformata TaxID=630403 RepID=UPI0004632D39|nr:phosphodiesterase [Tomitella biformata]
MSPTRIAEHGRPTHCLVHLSDTHLVADGLLYGQLDADDRLRQIFAELTASRIRPDALVFTGDLADQGEPEAYARLRAMVDPVAAELGAQVLWAMGNHDDRAHFRSSLLGEEPSTGPVDRAHTIDGLRVLTLDTSVPGHHHGELDDGQLDWLAAQLATAAPHGTILAMHHPPVPCVQDLAVLVELRAQERLAQVLRGSDVRAILAGHLHFSTTAMFAGIPVSVAAATCYTQDLNAPDGSQRGRDGAQGLNLVHVYQDTIVHSAVPIGAYESVGELVSAAATARRLAAAGIRIPGPDMSQAPRISQGAGMGK